MTVRSVAADARERHIVLNPERVLFERTVGLEFVMVVI